MNPISFHAIDWNTIPKIAYNGEHGIAYWQTVQFPGLRIRIVEYSAGYLADHWCKKGHIVHCLEGEFVTEQENGDSYSIKQGMTYVVSDEASSHRSKTDGAVRLLIVDGDFLQ